jgi:hypothetical protein
MSGYNLWNPPPYNERKKVLDGLKTNPRKKIDSKKIKAALEANEKKFECFKPRPISDAEWAAMFFRPLF